MDAKYGNAFSSGWLCNTPDIVAADYLYSLGLRHVTVVANDYAFGWLSGGGFITQFTMLGGHIDKALWPPLTTVDFSPYVTAIPHNTQAVFAEVVGAGAVDFTKAYAQYGLRPKIPLYGNTLLYDQSVLPSEVPADVLGNEGISQYCDALTNAANNKFVTAFQAGLRRAPRLLRRGGLRARRTGRGRAEAAARRRLEPARPRSHAMESTPITAPRGPVTLNKTVDAPAQNVYVCKVENVNGTLEDVPIKTYPNVPPWGTLPYTVWQAEYAKDSTGAPSA